jgi:hypothetical protein
LIFFFFILNLWGFCAKNGHPPTGPKLQSKTRKCFK